MLIPHSKYDFSVINMFCLRTTVFKNGLDQILIILIHKNILNVK